MTANPLEQFAAYGKRKPAIVPEVPERIAKRRKWEREQSWGGTFLFIVFAAMGGYAYFVEHVSDHDLVWIGYLYAFMQLLLWMGSVTDLLLLIAFGEEEKSK